MDKCSFCGISETFAGAMMRGPEVMICRECAELAVESLAPRQPNPPGPGHLTQFAAGGGAGGTTPEKADRSAADSPGRATGMPIADSATAPSTTC